MSAQSNRLRYWLVLVFFCTTVATGRSALIEWNTDLDGSWFDQANWLPQQLPTLADDVLIDRMAADPTILIEYGDDAEAGMLTNREIIVVEDGYLTAPTITQDGTLTVEPGDWDWSTVRFDSLQNNGDFTCPGGYLHLFPLTPPTPALLTNDGLLEASSGGYIAFCSVAYAGSGTMRADGDNSSIDSYCSYGGFDPVSAFSSTGSLEALNGGLIDLSAPETTFDGPLQALGGSIWAGGDSITANHSITADGPGSEHWWGGEISLDANDALTINGFVQAVNGAYVRLQGRSMSTATSLVADGFAVDESSSWVNLYADELLTIGGPMGAQNGGQIYAEADSISFAAMQTAIANGTGDWEWSDVHLEAWDTLTLDGELQAQDSGRIYAAGSSVWANGPVTAAGSITDWDRAYVGLNADESLVITGPLTALESGRISADANVISATETLTADGPPSEYWWGIRLDADDALTIDGAVQALSGAQVSLGGRVVSITTEVTADGSAVDWGGSYIELYADESLSIPGGLTALDGGEITVYGPWIGVEAVTADGATGSDPSSVRFNEYWGPGGFVGAGAPLEARNGGQITAYATEMWLDDTVTADGATEWSTSFIGLWQRYDTGTITLDSSVEALDGGYIDIGASTITGGGTLHADGPESAIGLSAENISLATPTLANGAVLALHSLETEYYYGPTNLDVAFASELTVPSESTLEVTNYTGGGVALHFNLTNDGWMDFGADYESAPFLLEGNLSTTESAYLHGLALDVTGDITNTGSLALEWASLSVGGTLSNEGSMWAAGSVLDGVLTNHGEMVAECWGDFTLSGAVQNNGVVRVAGGAECYARMTLDAAIFNQDGEIVVGYGGWLDLARELINDGVIVLEAGSIGGATLINSDGAEVVGAGGIYCNLINEGVIRGEPLYAISLYGDSVINNGLLHIPIFSFLRVFTPGFVQSGELNLGLDAIAFFMDTFNNTGHVTLGGGAISAPQVVNESTARIDGFGEIEGYLANEGTVEFFGDSIIIGDVHNRDGGLLKMRNQSLLITGSTTNDGTIETLNAEIIFEGGLENNGTLNFDPAVLVVSDLFVGPEGVLAAMDNEPNEIIITGDFENASVQSSRWSTEAAILRFNGGDGRQSRLEAASTDLGPSCMGSRHNFGWGTLHLGPSATTVTLRDEFANGDSGRAEAVYVNDLILDAGTVLDLNGLNLYYRGTFVEDGTVVGGSPIFVEALGDFDGNSTTDLRDFAVLQRCFTGPAGGPMEPECEAGGLSTDGIIDLADFAEFHCAFNGP